MSRLQHSVSAASALLTFMALLCLSATPAAANFVFGLHVTNAHDPAQPFDFSGDGFISLPQLIPGSDPTLYDDVEFQFTATILDADPDTLEPVPTIHTFTKADLDLSTPNKSTSLNWLINDVGGLPNLAILSLYTKSGAATNDTPFFGLTLQYDERSIFDPCSEDSPIGPATGRACKIVLTQGDPNSFGYTGNFAQPNLIPLPGTVWLLVPGLVALAAFGSRSKRELTLTAPDLIS